MQPSAAATAVPPQAWGLATLGVALIGRSASAERVQKDMLQNNRIPSVEVFLGTNKTVAQYLEAIKKQPEQVQALHARVCECMVNILLNHNIPLTPPVISPESRTLIVNIIQVIERPNLLTKQSPTIQIAAIETIIAALQKSKQRQ